MRKVILLLILVQISLIDYGQIIANHTIVDEYDKIPQQYLDAVKKMFVSVPGESHSEAYRTGALLLEQANATYAVSVVESGTPEAYTDTNLRLNRATWGNYANETGWQYSNQSIDFGGGEAYDYVFNATQAARVNAGLAYAHANDLTISAFGIGYCYWDGWYLSYITAVQAFIDYCAANSIPTKVFFTTGPVDNYMADATEAAYNSSLRWEYIRSYVNADASRILFDYADILCYNDAGELETKTWDGHTFNVIHPDNMTGGVGTLGSGHIGGLGCSRIAKAMWWMLARMAGWDGGTNNIPVTGITVTGPQTISTDNGTTQLTATVSPANATHPAVTWSIINGSGTATISAAGLVTALTDGTVTARATANDGSLLFGELVITITNQVIPVTGITVTGTQTISTDNGTTQLTSTVSPANATTKTVSWTISSGTSLATISEAGLVTALDKGTVTVRATTNDGTGVYGELLITISNQGFIPVTGQIIADHTVVDKFDEIPEQYINEVKKMLLITAGEQHSWAYWEGLLTLYSLYPSYRVSYASAGPPHPYTDQALRTTGATWGDYSNSTGWIHYNGEEDWFTNSTAVSRIKAGITYCNTNSLTISAIGFGWSYNAVEGNAAAGTDPVYGVHWYGSSVNGPEGDRSWGIDSDDNALTGNGVNMDTYLSVTQQYIDYCTANSIPTKVFFTTGPVDTYMGEAGYQGYLKYEHIRDYVKAEPTRILFDYADILCYDDDGTAATTTWNGNTFPIITSTNVTPATTGNISTAGSIRLAKAMWWMLARMAGWDGITTDSPVKGSTVSGSVGAQGTEEISMQEILPESKLLAYPNPVTGVLNIESVFTGEETYIIDLINVSGQIIINQRKNVIGGKFEIDMTDVSYGYYLLRIMTNRTVQFIRLIKY